MNSEAGGRELGKRLADELKLPVYDHEIIEQLAQKHALTPEYIDSLSENPVRIRYAYGISEVLVSLVAALMIRKLKQ